MSEVRKERTEWRDGELSKRHRLWGWDCPAVDIDFLMLEYTNAKAVALVEYKNEFAATQQLSSNKSLQAIRDLCDKAGLPFFVCRYAKDFSWFRGVPVNRKAQTVLSKITEFTEEGWVKLLYSLRSIDVPDEVIKQIKSVSVPDKSIPDNQHLDEEDDPYVPKKIYDEIVRGER